MSAATPRSGTGAAQAALARRSVPERIIDRILLVDDSDEDATQLLTVITERSSPTHTTHLEAQS